MRSEAAVQPLTEGEVAYPTPLDIEPVRVGKLALVTVGSAVYEKNPLPSRNGNAVKGYLSRGGAANDLQWSREAECLLHRVRNKVPVLQL